MAKPAKDGRSSDSRQEQKGRGLLSRLLHIGRRAEVGPEAAQAPSPHQPPTSAPSDQPPVSAPVVTSSPSSPVEPPAPAPAEPAPPDQPPVSGPVVTSSPSSPVEPPSSPPPQGELAGPPSTKTKVPWGVLSIVGCYVLAGIALLLVGLRAGRSARLDGALALVSVAGASALAVVVAALIWKLQRKKTLMEWIGNSQGPLLIVLGVIAGALTALVVWFPEQQTKQGNWYERETAGLTLAALVVAGLTAILAAPAYTDWRRGTVSPRVACDVGWLNNTSSIIWLTNIPNGGVNEIDPTRQIQHSIDFLLTVRFDGASLRDGRVIVRAPALDRSRLHGGCHNTKVSAFEEALPYYSSAVNGNANPHPPAGYELVMTRDFAPDSEGTFPFHLDVVGLPVDANITVLIWGANLNQYQVVFPISRPSTA